MANTITIHDINTDEDDDEDQEYEYDEEQFEDWEDSFIEDDDNDSDILEELLNYDFKPHADVNGQPPVQ